MPGPDDAAAAAVRERDGQLTKPAGSLGRLEWLVEWLAAWQSKPMPTLDRPLVCVFAGSHGVDEARRLRLSGQRQPPDAGKFRGRRRGGQPDLRRFGLGFKVFDLALDLPTQDIAEAPAMDEKTCVATMAFGMEAIAGGADLLAIGEMGIGNTTIAAAIYAALYGGPAGAWVGRGTGVDDDGSQRARRRAVEAALDRHRDGLERPSRGAAPRSAAARSPRWPERSSPRACNASRSCSTAMSPPPPPRCCTRWTRARSTTASPAISRPKARISEVLERLGKTPLLALGLRLGEASGAALAVAIVKAALACHRGMATFEQAGVSQRSG